MFDPVLSIAELLKDILFCEVVKIKFSGFSLALDEAFKGGLTRLNFRFLNDELQICLKFVKDGLRDGTLIPDGRTSSKKLSESLLLFICL